MHMSIQHSLCACLVCHLSCSLQSSLLDAKAGRNFSRSYFWKVASELVVITRFELSMHALRLEAVKLSDSSETRTGPPAGHIYEEEAAKHQGHAADASRSTFT